MAHLPSMTKVVPPAQCHLPAVITFTEDTLTLKAPITLPSLRGKAQVLNAHGQVLRITHTQPTAPIVLLAQH